MVNVGTSAETGPTVPKGTVAADRRTGAVRARTSVAIRAAARTVAAGRDRVVAPVSGAIATTDAVTTAVMIAVVTTGETTGAENVAETTADSSRAAVTIAAEPAGRLVAAVVKVGSARPVAVRPSVRSVATLAPTSRTSRTRSRPASWIPRFAATC